MNIFKKISLALVLVLVVVMAASCNLGDHQHNLSKVEKIDATCTQAGQEAYYACDGCDAIFADVNGKKTLEAPVVIEALGHLLSGVPGTEATCTEGGVADCYKCARCDTLFADINAENVITSPETTSPKGHSLVKTEAKAVSCTENGNEAYWSCSSCSKLFSDAEGQNETTLENVTIISEGHSLVETAAKAVSCTENGNIAYWTCESCGKIYSDAAGESEITIADTVIKSEGHSYGSTLTVSGAVTEYEPGESFDLSSLEVKLVCADCSEAVAVSGYSVSKTENLQPEDNEIVISYTDGSVTYTATVKITVKHVHTTGELVPATAPTCIATGTLAYYECTACHDKFEDKAATKPIDDITVGTVGHSGVKTEAKAASCTESGNNAYWTCSACGGVFADADCTVSTTVEAETIPAADHSTKVVADDDGHWTECENCDYSTSKESHSGAAYPDAKPECDVCGAEFGEASWDGWVEFRPGVVEITGSVVTSASHVDVDGIMASKYVLGAASAGAESAIWTNSDRFNYKDGRYQVRIPTVSADRYVYLYVSNDGDTAVNFRIYSENYGDKGGTDVALGAGESGWFKYTVNTGTTIGSNVNIKLLSDLASETAIIVYGYFYLEEAEIAELQILNKDQLKLSYEVGEKFDISNIQLGTYIKVNDGLLSDTTAELYYINSNYTISGLENGQVLSEGTYTVTVSFGGKSVELQVIVSSHEHVIEYVPYQGATCTENGNEAYYVCNVDGCGQLFGDAEGNSPISSITTLPAGHIESAAIPGYKACCSRCGEEYGEVLSPDGWVHFAPGVVWSDYYEGISGTVNGADYINYELITLEDGMNATKFTFAAGTPANAATAFWNDQDLAHNIKVPVRTEGTRTIVVITNHGTEDLTFTFGQVDSARDTGSGTVLVPAGKTAAVEFAITGGADLGNNGWIAVRDEVKTETSITVYGFFNVEDDVEGLKIKTPASKLIFAAGDMFTAEGLRLAMTNDHGGGAYYGQTEIYSNFSTDLDGYTFTAEDEGKKTVTVSFGGKTVTYEIEVAGHQHQTELVAGQDPVKCEKDGYEAYYRCTVAGCEAIFSDASASNSISAPNAISAHGKATISNGKVVCSDCMSYDLDENWVLYNITTNVGGNSVTNGKITSSSISGIPSSMIHIGAGTTAGSYFQLCMSSNDADRQTVIPNLGDNRPEGALRHVLVFYKNYGTEDVILNLQNDNGGGNGSVTVPAGGTAVSAFDVLNVGGSNWFYLYVDSNVTTDVDVEAYGYIYINDGEAEINSIKNAATKTEFKVGDSFSAEGLILEAKIPSSNTMTLHVSTGYTTSLDGVVFDAAGSYTVEVYFAGAKTEYTITVSE